MALIKENRWQIGHRTTLAPRAGHAGAEKSTSHLTVASGLTAESAEWMGAENRYIEADEAGQSARV